MFWVVELFWNVKNGRFDIAEIKLRAERRIGEFSKELPKAQTIGLKNVSLSHDGETTKTSILKEAGITHCERYEAIASLPDEVFEKHIQEVKQSNEELTLRRIRGCPLPVILGLTSVVKLLEYRQNNLYLL